MGYSGDTFLDMRAAKKFDHADLLMLDAIFNCADESLPWVNVLTRTHNREKYYNVMLESVNNQTYENINHIVGSDLPCIYEDDFIPLKLEASIYTPIPEGHYYAPWNIFLNTLAEEVEDGWIMYLDDDDKFMHDNAVTEIVKHINSEDDLLIWKVQITPSFIVPSYSFGKKVTAGDVSGIGFMFHSKHLPIDWGNISYGDFRVITQLINKGLKPVWIDQILTTTQEGAHNGK